MSAALPTTSRIKPVILSGGSGTRLWPLSRRSRPKQMLPLLGDQTMLQMTAARVAGNSGFAPPVIVTGEAQVDAIVEQLSRSGGGQTRLIVEPSARNTAPAIALAALDAEPDELLLVMPSDHLISDLTGFLEAVARAAPLAEEGWLVTFGIQPKRPETGYGYIQRAEELAPGAYRARRFVEKPGLATAEAYLAEGGYDWNAGIFLFTAGAYLAALKEHAPEIEAAARESMRGVERAGSQVRATSAAYARARSESIDTAVMEHAARVAVAPMDVGWSDVGSWEALYEASAKDEARNAVAGDALLIDASRCLVRSDGPVVVALGVSDLAIVATADAILVMPIDQSQRVREALDALTKRGDALL